MSSTSFIKLLLLLMFHCFGEGLSLSYQKKLEVQKHLKKLNKSPVKSIKSPDGDIIDCVHISRQPAFDHPLLKNHTIQLMPNYHPEGIYGKSKLVSSLPNTGGEKIAKITQTWQLKGKCPKGTIPIRKTKSRDVLRASSIHGYGRKTENKDKKEMVTKLSKSAEPTDGISQSGHQHAIAYVKGEKYYGTKATMNVWQPKLEHPNEFSLSQLWILSGSFDSDLNSIEVGWQVSPNLYGDNNTRFFSYWTGDGYEATGCYNLLCSGFIQLSNEISFGAAISPISSSGASQYEITVLVWKNLKDGNWWMQFGKDTVVGYWPGSLFSHLNDSASMIQWGGEIINSQSEQGKHTSTQMGSGLFPDQGYGKASFFNKIQVIDDSNQLIPPKGITTFTDESNCYDLVLGKSVEWGDHFYYGGPGRNPKCP